jgi:hypothetical protein
MSDNRHDPPLPATGRFVLGLGIFLLAVWLLMFALMASRW